MVKIEFASALNAQIESLGKIILALEIEIAVRKTQRLPIVSDLDNTAMISIEIELAMNQRIISELESNLAGKKEWLANLKERVVVEDAEREDSYNKMISEHKSIISKGDSIKDPHDKNRFDYALAEFKLWMAATDKEDHKEASVYYYKLLVETLNFAGVPVMSIAV